MLSQKNIKILEKMIAEKFDIDVSNVVPEAELIDDLGAESLAIVEFVMLIEEFFDIEISDEDAERIKTVQDIFNLVEEKIS